MNAVDPSGHDPGGDAGKIAGGMVAKVEVDELFAFGLGIGVLIGEGVTAIHDIREYGYGNREKFHKMRDRDGSPTWIHLRPDDPGVGSDHRRGDPGMRTGGDVPGYPGTPDDPDYSVFH